MRRRTLGVLVTAVVLLLAAPGAAGASPQIALTGSDGQPLRTILDRTALLPGDDASGVAMITNTGSSPGDLQITASRFEDTSGGGLARLVQLRMTVADHAVWVGSPGDLLTTTVNLGVLGESQSAELRVSEGLAASVRDPALEGAGVDMVLTFALVDTGGSTSQVTVPLTGQPTEVAGRSFNRGGGVTAFTGVDATVLVELAVVCLFAGAALRHGSERGRRQSRDSG